MTEVGPLEIGEIKRIGFNFASEKAETATLTAASQTVTIVVLDGTDVSPNNVMVGSPVIAGDWVYQKVQPGVAGCKYKLKAFASDSDGLRHGVPCVLRVVQG